MKQKTEKHETSLNHDTITALAFVNDQTKSSVRWLGNTSHKNNQRQIFLFCMEIVQAYRLQIVDFSIMSA